MVFSSLTFLFAFFPITAALYFLIPNRLWRNAVLLVASLLFYAWGEPVYVLLLLLATLESWLGGLLLARQRGARARRWVLGVTTALLIGNLAVFKYLGFVCQTLAPLIPALGNVEAPVLPIGISFYTFQILSYNIDLYRGRVSLQRRYLRLLLYVSFFPQLIAGPIVRYETVERELTARRESWNDAGAGIRRFIRGLAKKVLIANSAARIAEIVYAGDPAVFGTGAYWLAAVCYTLQIYYDFSGYSDMAIGLGRLFGFHFPENFNYPYVSRSITEFWRRWHISLSTWFRDYVYIPLGGNRVSRVKWVRNILIVWALTGLWHGAAWNFVLWGLYYAALLLLEKAIPERVLARVPGVLRWLITMVLVTLGWVLFERTSMSELGFALQSLFVFRPTKWITFAQYHTDALPFALMLLPGVLFAFPILRRPTERMGETALGALVLNVVCLALLLLCIAVLINEAFNPFIYFRF
ncbi:MAG: MBOAT family protein [Oscillospiraceae bacterium]|nr:MBOAT family protein [Oscillospiraceae bacterium]